MAAPSETKRQTSPEEQEAQARFAVGAIALVATAKYLPIVGVGVLLGLMVHRGARGQSGLRRFQALAFGLLLFALVAFAIFGLPLTGQAAGSYPGLLSRSDYLQQWVVDAIRFWNSNFPNIAIIKAMRFDLRHVTLFSIARYFWISVVAATIYVLWREIWAVFRPADPTERQAIGVGTKIAAFPADCVHSWWTALFPAWVRQGHESALSVRAEGIGSLGIPLLAIGIAALFAALLNYFLLSQIPYADVRDTLSTLVFGPAAGLSVGLFVGLIPFGVGDQILTALFGSRPEGVKQKTEFQLGRDFQGKPYSLTERNLSYHVEVIAPTGSGKTNLLKNLIADRIHRGHGLIFLDLKAEFQVVGWMMRAAAAAGREGELRLVSLANRELSVPYNPIKCGSAPEIHSQLMNAMTWSEDYYRKISSMALMTLLRGLTEYRDRTGENFHLGHLYELLNEPGLLRALNEKLASMNCPAARDVALLAEKLDRPSERDKLTGLTANLGLLIHSAAGPLVSDDVRGGSFDFREAVDEGRITYVLMNSMKLRETASVFGKMILQDLMRLVGDRYGDIDGGKKHRPVTLIIDEFASFAIPEFIEFMDRARGAGIGIVFAHQSRADLRAITPEFQDRIEANSNTAIVSGVKSSEDAEYYAGMLGTRTTTKETVQVEDGLLGHNKTGMKSLRDVEEYVVHPNRLKDLSQGEVFTISRTVDSRWGLVRIPEAPEFLDARASSSDLVQALSKIRETYMTSSQDKYLDLHAPARAPGLTKRPNKIGAEIEMAAEDASGPDLWS